MTAAGAERYVSVLTTFLLTIELMSSGCSHQSRGQNETYDSEQTNKAVASSAPRTIATIIHDNVKVPSVAWAESQNGLAVGIGEVRTSLKSPLCPIIHAYLENRGNTDISHVIRSRSRFILELDGKYYAERDFGGKTSYMPPGRSYGPMAVATRGFREIKEVVPHPVIDYDASPPALTSGEHTLRLHFKVDGKLVPSGLVTTKVTVSPYPEDTATSTIISELHNSNSDVRRTAALAAGDLRLVGTRDALVEVLKDQDHCVRRYAAVSLGKIGDSSVVGALRELVDDSNIPTRLAVVTSLVELGEPLAPELVVPIIKSNQGNEWQNAIWLVRRHCGENAVPTLVRCLEMDNASVTNYYNYTLVWQIAACGGPQLRYHHDFDAEATAQQIKENKEVLNELANWLKNRTPE